MDKAEAVKVAVEIATALGEVGDRPRAQIARIVMLMGEEWTRAAMQQVFALPITAEIRWTKDNKPRTTGGVFFAVCRTIAWNHVESGKMKRRDFFRCFYDRAPEPKTPKTRPPKKARAPRPDPMAAARRVRERRAAPEVYTVRRAAR